MSKALRLPEKWFRRGLWLVAVVFASFLIGLGGLVVGDLPQVESPRTVEDFIAPEAAEPVKAEIKAADADHDKAETALENARLKYQAAQSRYRSARETFDNWVATRRATARPLQIPAPLHRQWPGEVAGPPSRRRARRPLPRPPKDLRPRRPRPTPTTLPATTPTPRPSPPCPT